MKIKQRLAQGPLADVEISALPWAIALPPLRGSGQPDQTRQQLSHLPVERLSCGHGAVNSSETASGSLKKTTVLSNGLCENFVLPVKTLLCTRNIKRVRARVRREVLSTRRRRPPGTVPKVQANFDNLDSVKPPIT